MLVQVMNLQPLFFFPCFSSKFCKVYGEHY